MLQIHTQAPLDSEFINEQGEVGTLRALLGSWVVVYFYPKDATPGCTLEAEGFRDLSSEFKNVNTIVLGVSKDSCASHKKFIEKKALTFSLVADTEHVLMEAFGVWGERKFMGRTYMGTSRSTFLIDPRGVIAEVWPEVKPVGHPQEVLARLRALQVSVAK
jgi:thioredoxin-dependent peroxiredoxin